MTRELIRQSSPPRAALQRVVDDPLEVIPPVPRLPGFDEGAGRTIIASGCRMSLASNSGDEAQPVENRGGTHDAAEVSAREYG
jgi:hypothetical protein